VGSSVLNFLLLLRHEGYCLANNMIGFQNISNTTYNKNKFSFNFIKITAEGA